MLRKRWLLSLLVGMLLCLGQFVMAAQTPLTQTRAYQAKGDGNGKIYFVKQETGETTFPLYSMNADGSQVKEISNGTIPALWTADISPDHSTIVYVVENEMGDDIYTAKADGSGATKIYSTGDNINAVRFSPDGQSIGFITQDITGGEQNGMLAVMSITGANPRSLSPARFSVPARFSAAARYSSPARKAVSGRKYGSMSHKMFSSSLSGTTVTSNTVTGMFAFSPDSSKIAFSNNNGYLCIIKTDGTGLTAMSDDGYDPYWNSNGMGTLSAG